MDSLPAVGLTPEQLTGVYRQMLLIRRFEEALKDLYARGEMPGLAHVYIGEEAVAVGACTALRRDDFITSTHRGHGQAMATATARAAKFTSPTSSWACWAPTASSAAGFAWRPAQPRSA